MTALPTFGLWFEKRGNSALVNVRLSLQLLLPLLSQSFPLLASALPGLTLFIRRLNNLEA
jgi:hypothetical protein